MPLFKPRDRIIKLRVNDEEYLHIKRKAISRRENLSQYIRSAALQRRDLIKNVVLDELARLNCMMQSIAVDRGQALDVEKIAAEIALLSMRLDAADIK